MIALLGAFGQELAGLRGQMVVEEIVAGPPCRTYRGKLRGKDCLLVETGIGRRRAENATLHVLERYPFTALISLGFAGALIPELKIGDIVVCSTLHYASEVQKEDSNLPAYATDVTLYDLASREAGDESIRSSLGSCVTVPRVVSGAQKKQKLHQESRAEIVDMESYWIARIVSARQIPFIAIRSVSDTLQDDLRAVDHILDSEGRLQWKRVVPYFLVHPHHLPSVFAAFRSMRRAERNLTAFISDLVTRM